MTSEQTHLLTTLHRAKSLEELHSVLNRSLQLQEFSLPKGKTEYITKKQLHFFVNNAEKKYSSFSIPKKSGGERIINAPDKTLKKIQRAISYLLTLLHESNEFAHGFLPQRSIVTNAQNHTQKPFVLNVDLENFFPTIAFGRVVTVLQFKPYSLDKNVAYLITRLCCSEGVLPQGAPTSPIISNIICQKLDRRIAQLSIKQNVTYSRYADDLTFSSNKEFTNEILATIEEIITDEGFALNFEKVRLQDIYKRQEVTGLTVNEKVNVSRDYIKTVKAMLHNWEVLGYEKAKAKFQTHYVVKNSQKKKLPEFKHVLKGKIDFLKMVRGAEDPTYLKFIALFKELESGNISLKKEKLTHFQQPTIEHNPRRVVQFLRKFRTVNDSGFRELLHDPDVSDFDFMANLAKVNAQLDSLQETLTPKLHSKLKRFVDIYNTEGVAYFEKHGVLPLKGKKKQAVSKLAALFLKKAKVEVKEDDTKVKDSIPPNKAVSKAAKVFREQIRIGSDFFQDMILVNALKPDIDKLNKIPNVHIEYMPEESIFASNAAFFTDSWEAKKAIVSLIKDLVSNQDYETTDGTRSVYLFSNVKNFGTEETPLFATTIVALLQDAMLKHKKAFVHPRLIKTKEKLWSLAEWTISYRMSDGKQEREYILQSNGINLSPVAAEGGVGHILTFYHS